jgi:hypothetical protein
MPIDQEFGLEILEDGIGPNIWFEVVVWGSTGANEVVQLSGALRSDVGKLIPIVIQAEKFFARKGVGKASDIHTVVFLETLAERIERCLLDGTLVEKIVSDWTTQAEALLQILRQRRKRMSVVSASAAISHPEQLTALLGDRLGLSLFMRRGLGLCPVPTPNVLSRLSEAVAVMASARLRDVVSELAASALMGVELPILDPSTLMANLSAARTEWVHQSGDIDTEAARAKLGAAQVALLQQEIQQSDQSDSHILNSVLRKLSELLLHYEPQSGELAAQKTAILKQIGHPTSSSRMIVTLTDYIEDALKNIRMLEKRLAASNAEGESRKASNAALQAEIGGLLSDVEIRTAEAASLRSKVAALEVLLRSAMSSAQQYKNMLADTEGALSLSKTEIAERNLMIEELEAHRGALLQSTSWKITAPIRAVKFAITREKD